MRSPVVGPGLCGLLLAIGMGILTVACTIEPPEGTPRPPMAGALEPGPREAMYGRTGDEVVNNPQLRDKIHALFGADWSQGGKIRRGASVYFGRTEAPRGVRVGDRNYIAVTGCVPEACRAGERVLLLVQEGGANMLARLDEGGFSHYYAYGPDWGAAGSTQRAVDAAIQALSRTGDPYPRG